jgi:hypothetical protein
MELMGHTESRIPRAIRTRTEQWETKMIILVAILAAFLATSVAISSAAQAASATDPRAAWAIRWEQSHAGSSAWNELCETAVENAYGTVGQYRTAAADYQVQLHAGRIHNDRNAPAGSLVFFSGSDPSTGHVGIATGDSATYWTTDGTIHVAPLSEGLTYYGWSYAPNSWPGLSSPPPPPSVVPIHTAVALIPHDGGSGYTLDGFGNIRPFGNAPAVSSSTASWPNWDIARGIALSPSSTPQAVTGYVLDGYGGIHPFAAGSAAPPPAIAVQGSWPGSDIARAIVLSTPTSGYVLDGYGGVDGFAAAGTALPPAPATFAHWPGWDIARAIVLSTPDSGYVLDGYGAMHPFGPTGGTPPGAATFASWPGWDIARAITLTAPDAGYVLDGYGGVHPFAPAGATPPPAQAPGNTPGQDVFRAIATDPTSGMTVDVRAYNTDGSGGNMFSFGEPPTEARHAATALIPHDGASGYTVDGFGNIRRFGNAPAVSSSTASWPNWDIARGIALSPSSTPQAVTGYVLDGYGGIHPFAAGSAAPPPGPATYGSWPGWDIARAIVLSTPTTGYTLDGYGGIHPFAPAGTAVPPGPAVGPSWPGWDIARAMVLSTPNSGYVLDGYGAMHPFGPTGGTPPGAATFASWPGWDIARSIVLTTPNSGYVLDGYGGTHPFAPAGIKPPPLVSVTAYWSGWDVFRGLAIDPATGKGVDVITAASDGSGGTVFPVHVGV